DYHQQQHGPRRIRPVAPLSFKSMVGRAIWRAAIQQIAISLERLSVREEIQNIFSQHDHLPHRSLPLHIQAIDVSPWLKLSFTKKLMLPIFTNNKLTDDQFNAAIVKSREGRRPLLVGSTLNVVMNNQGVAVINDVAFTDNSSWIRSVSSGSVLVSSDFLLCVQEALPPLLTDNIWAQKHRKRWAIDKRLESRCKNLVGMSDRQWRTTLNHAKTCNMGRKCYIFKYEGCDLIFNPIGDFSSQIGGQTCSLQQLHHQQMVQVKQLASTTYEQWDHLEEVVVNDTELVTYEGLSLFPPEKPVSRTVTSNVTMSSNNNNSLDSMVAIAASDAMYCIPSMAVDDDHFTWNNSTNLGCWDQVD
ncbi:hypothetical protein ZWY2020_008667, partial [Hordeum vulgare]